MLTLHKSVYFNVKDTKGTYGVWQALSNLYDKKSAASQVFWLKKLIHLCKKETTHLDEFKTILSQLQAQEVEFQDSDKAMFLLVTFPDSFLDSWDTFRISISDLAPKNGLKCTDVENSLLMKKLNCKNVDDCRSSNAMHFRGRQQSRGNHGSNDQKKSKSKERSKFRYGKDVECYYCHKKGHVKKDCYKWKNKQEKKNKDDKGKEKISDSANNVKIEELNALTSDSDKDVFYTGSLSIAFLVASNGSYEQDWIMDSDASFHVTPHREWFSYYEGRHGIVHSGNNYACEIFGAGDIKMSLPNGSQFTLTNVRHVPKLTVSIGQLDDDGYHTIFGNQSWRLCKGNLVTMKGVKCGTLYPLYVFEALLEGEERLEFLAEVMVRDSLKGKTIKS
ncbi:hypothetical protein L7F22_065108 [Adiantum nelumboides]|nr:hypothetical protein [Adiantum nelumboides]